VRAVRGNIRHLFHRLYQRAGGKRGGKCEEIYKLKAPRRLAAFAVALALAVSFPPPRLFPARAADTRGEFRGVWVATVINLDYPSRPGLTAPELKAEADAIVSGAAAAGFNAVILQVRPLADAFYRSDIFPVSQYITGTQGEAAPDGLDILAYFTQRAHEEGVQLHAWVNPFRVARNAADFAALASGHPALLHPEWLIAHTDGAYYFDPGNPDARELVVRGVREIAANYDVDGVHFDDYFYPGADFGDDASFELYGKGYADRANWRRDNVNSLIRDTRAAVRAVKPGCVFGVSPSGIWANNTTSPLGSATGGYESYVSSFADTRRWVKNEWVDYIAPQLYWQTGHKTADFAELAEWWANVARGTAVKLYIGHAAYLAENTDPQSPWAGTGELIAQMELGRELPEVSGSIQFRWSFIAASASLRAALTTFFNTRPPVDSPASGAPMPLPNGGLSVGRPGADMSVDEDTFYIVGASDPALPLTCNGTEVAERTEGGYFGLFVTLRPGANTFTFRQGGASVRRVITLRAGSSASAPAVMDKAEIIRGTAYPLSEDEIFTPGASVTLRCAAPIGAKVTARFAGGTIELAPASSTPPNASRIYRTNYTALVILPHGEAEGRLVDMGAPVYTMEYKGITSVRQAGGSIRVAGAGAPVYAEVTAESAFVYAAATTNGGSVGELSRGQFGAVSATVSSGAWVRLPMELWVQRADVRLVTGRPAHKTQLVHAKFTADARWESLVFTSNTTPVTAVTVEANTVTLRIADAAGAPVPSPLPEGFIQDVRVTQRDGFTIYALTLSRLYTDGFFTEAVGEGFALRVKKPFTQTSAAMPLAGLTVLIDPGHGGTDTGAPGAYSGELLEKDINLAMAKKLRLELEALGAETHLTRSSDRAVSLSQRVLMSRGLLPDLYISLHCNSMDYHVDASNIRGLSTYYRQSQSAPLAKLLYENAQTALGLRQRNANQANLYVCRPNWSPHIIVEAAFLCNPQDYEWLLTEYAQNDLAASLAQSVHEYFTL
jgi:uncharacterized lipoprotein YddW (UPF0748 family)/N-acetylmuramoyl-L-alanine amidase